jgi:hypothetical protein
VNTNTGAIRRLLRREVEMTTRTAEDLAKLEARLARQAEMMLPLDGPLSEKQLRDKTPLDRLKILRAQQKRERRRHRNLRQADR